jgi:hypothetical protein
MQKIIISALLAFAMIQNLAYAKDEPKEVKLGLYITNLYDINFAKNAYTVQFWQWFHHDGGGYTPNKSIEIMNAKNFSKQSQNEEIVKGINWDTANVKATINQQWKVSNFPFDIQTFSIVMEDIDSPAQDLVLKPDLAASKIDPKAIPEGWKLKKFEMVSSVNSYETAFGDPSASSGVKQDFSRMTANVHLERHGWRLFSTTFIGFFVATALLLVVFIITSIPRAVAEIPQQPRITLITGALFSAVGSVYGLSAMLPYTTEFTLADSLQISTFAGVAFATIGSMSSDILRKNGHPILATRANQVMFSLFILMSFGLNGYMIIRALG